MGLYYNSAAIPLIADGVQFPRKNWIQLTPEEEGKDQVQRLVRKGILVRWVGDPPAPPASPSSSPTQGPATWPLETEAAPAAVIVSAVVPVPEIEKPAEFVESPVDSGAESFTKKKRTR